MTTLDMFFSNSKENKIGDEEIGPPGDRVIFPVLNVFFTTLTWFVDLPATFTLMLVLVYLCFSPELLLGTNL